MSEKKQKKKGFGHFLKILLILLILSAIVGFVAAPFIDLGEFNFATQLLGEDIDPSISEALTIGAIMLFACLMIWMFSAT